VRNFLNRIGCGLVFTALLLFPTLAQAQQINSNTAVVSLSLTVTESLTISASPSPTTFNSYNPSLGTASTNPITVTTSAVIGNEYGSVAIGGWLSSSTAALVNGSSNIPSSEVYSSVTSSGAGIGGTSTAGPCTATTNTASGTIGVAGATCPGLNANWIDMVPGAAHTAGDFTVNDAVTLSLVGATGLVPGSYTGTISFEAFAW
jgi:hypothetical protein